MCLKDDIGPQSQVAGAIEVEKSKNNGVQCSYVGGFRPELDHW